MKEDKGTLAVCECGGKLVYQKEWDRLFDSFDSNTPSSTEDNLYVYALRK